MKNSTTSPNGMPCSLSGATHFQLHSSIKACLFRPNLTPLWRAIPGSELSRHLKPSLRCITAWLLLMPNPASLPSLPQVLNPRTLPILHANLCLRFASQGSPSVTPPCGGVRWIISRIQVMIFDLKLFLFWAVISTYYSQLFSESIIHGSSVMVSYFRE